MKKRLVPICFLLAYHAILIQVMVFKWIPMIRLGHIRLNFGGTHDGPANFIPFKTILSYLLSEKGLMIGGFIIYPQLLSFKHSYKRVERRSI